MTIPICQVNLHVQVELAKSKTQMKKIIHVSQPRIRKNIKEADVSLHEAPIICRTYKNIEYGNSVAILDDNGKEVARIVYSPHKPLSCGARVWIETKSDVVVVE